jgi:hypothetical protein
MWTSLVSPFVAFLVVFGLAVWRAGHYNLLEGFARTAVFAVAGVTVAGAIDRGAATFVKRRERRRATGPV